MKGAMVAAALALTILGTGSRSFAQETGEARKESKEGKHGWLGVAIQDVTPRVARDKDLTVKSGALVQDVTDESPADRAGIKEDDVIVEFNGKPVEVSDDLIAAVQSSAPGEKAKVTLYHGKEKRNLEVTVGKAPRRNFAFSMRGPAHIRIPRMPHMRMFRTDGVMGLTLRELKGQLGEYFEAPNGRGVLVEEVEHESAGEKGGFKAGDVIVRVGKESVENTEEIEDALHDAKKGEKVEVGILRKGTQKTLTVEAEGADREGWNDSESFRFDGDAFGTHVERDSFRRDMQKLKEELRAVGSQIKIQMRDLGRTLKGVVL